MLFVSETFSKWFCQAASMKINSSPRPRPFDLRPLRFSYFSLSNHRRGVEVEPLPVVSRYLNLSAEKFVARTRFLI